jgi:hypothetical protein
VPTFAAVQGELLLLLVVHLVLTGLPGVAAALFAAARGVRQTPILLAVLLAASGVGAMAGFWAYYADPVAGETFSFFLAFASGSAIGWLLSRRAVERQVLHELAVPLALWALGSCFLVFLGFMHGGIEHPLSLSQVRFFETLPGDNLIPPFFADWFYANGHHGTPPEFPGEWLASDRPPLQMGYAMVERPFAWDTSGLHYQVLGVVLQQLWIVGLWALLLAARVSRATRALTMGIVLLSGLAIVNGFYVWPKLLPAAFLLAAAAIVLTPLWEELRGSLWAAALFAALCGLAMLGHGASVFGIVPLLAIAAWRGMPGWRWLGVAALVGVVALVPWSAYQKYGDPPGNRLVKWQIGGVVEVDDRSVGEAIADTYSEIGLDGAVEYKLDNFKTMAGGKEAYETLKGGFEEGSLAAIVKAIRAVDFFYLLPSLGLLLLGPVAMALRWRRGPREEPEWSFALLCFAAFGIGAVVWGLLIIGGDPARTSIHVGSYLVPILGICGCVAALRATLPRPAVPYLLAVAALSLAIAVPVYRPDPGSSFSALNALLAAAALAGFGVLAARIDSRA